MGGNAEVSDRGKVRQCEKRPWGWDLLGLRFDRGKNPGVEIHQFDQRKIGNRGWVTGTFQVWLEGKRVNKGGKEGVVK